MRPSSSPSDAGGGLFGGVLSRGAVGDAVSDVAWRSEDGYRFDVRLQGPDETVFFAV